jgi:hypothetical protein
MLGEGKSGERVRRYDEGWKGGGGLKFLSVQLSRIWMVRLCREFCE